jgi:hypothetical protein
MKLKTTIHSVFVASLSALAINNLHADVVQILNFSVTTFTQSPISDSGTNSVAAAPKVSTHKTADLLRALAQDEFAAGTWPSNSFPATAKLAVNNDGFFVINGTNFLVSVTNVMSFQAGENDIYSGKRGIATGLATPTLKRLQIGRITFDDTAISGGSNLKFFIQGLITDSQTDTNPNASGIYAETQSGRMTNGAGEGVDSDGNSFVLTGTVTVAGKATLQLPPP